jgi:glucokinase
MSAQRRRLLGDIGGTNARFALLEPGGGFSRVAGLPSGDFPDLGAAAARSLELLAGAGGEAVREAAIAVAGPVQGDRIELTNVDWRFSIAETRRRLGLDRLVVINDLAALAWALPALDAAQARPLLAGQDGAGGADGGVRAVVGVGTGLGVGVWTRAGDGEVVLDTEGGHRDLAATTEQEWRIVGRLAERFGGHVSVERVVSGPGLSTLYGVLGELGGGAEPPLEPSEVGRRAAAGEPRGRAVLALFSRWLGAFCGDLALTVGSRAGVYLAGGVLPALGAAFDAAAFRAGFLAKGRFRGWLEAVPVRLVTDELAAFRGLARRLARAA